MDTPLRILVLEDEATDAEILIREVTRAGFTPEWRRVETEADFLAELAKAPDLILSDYGLPHFDGLRAVTLVRERGLDTPFILVSGALGEEAAVEAMKFGADDYLLKGNLVRLGLAIRRALEDKRLRDERKQAERDLIRANERFELATRAADLGIWDRDVSKNEIVWDDRMFELFGVKRDECSGPEATWITGIHPEDAARVEAETQQALRGDKEYNTEFRVVWPDGTVRHVSGIAQVVRDANGQPLRMTGVNYDITERKQAEERLRKLSHAVEQSPALVVITDKAGNIEYVNPKFSRTTGYSLEEVLGRNPRIWKSGETSKQEYEALWSTITAGGEWHGEFHNRTKNGELYLKSATISAIRDATGSITHFLAVGEDITARRKLEEQYRQSQKMEGIGQLASGVAHDFNNILAVIQMQASLLKDGDFVSPEHDELADDIGHAVQRAAALTRQLLLFSRKEVLRAQDLDLNESIESMLKMLRRTIGEDVQVQLNLARQPMWLHADPGMLDQVLLNLSVNARDAMPKGGQLVIETSVVEFDELAASQSANIRPGSFVCLSVSDTGCGMPPEVLARIFEPFFTTKEVGKGTGLGLATVFGIVQQHHGWIHVYSEVDQGATFRIYLPRLAARPGETSAETSVATLPGGNETILLVEDDSAVRLIVHRSLSRLGYQVLDAATGLEAVAVWKEHREGIHLVLTDMVMPGGMSGVDLGAQLLKENPELKVIYASGYSADVVGKEFPLTEGLNFLSKPYERAKLARAVRAMLDA